jgi:hypothetical protein
LKERGTKRRVERPVSAGGVVYSVLDGEIQTVLCGRRDISYWFVTPDDRVQCNKTVHFYLMAHKGGATDHHDPEFDEVRWFPSEEAVRSLAYANEARVMEKALAMIRGRASL